MAGLDADVSSYNQPLPVSPLETARNVGGLLQQQQALQRGDVSLSKEKLDLVTQQFGIMNNELAGLANDPSITKDQAAGRLNTIAKTLNLPPPVVQHMTDELNAAQPTIGPNGQQITPVQSFAKNAMVRGMQTMEKVQQLYGQNKTTQDNKNIYSGVEQFPIQGGGLRNITRMPVQIAPGTPGYDENNQQQFEQPAGPSGVVPVPRPRPSLAALTTGPTGPTVETTGGPGSPPATFAQRTDAAFPKPLKAGPSPLFEEGKKQYTADQELATQKLTAVKPALLALDMIPGLRSGPGTKTWNEAVAALKANGIVSIDAKNDSTAVYQEVNKYLSQYLKGRGTRSDADLVAAEESSPNVGKQISPALLKLTQTAVAQDRIEAARHTQFKKEGQTRTDFQNYGEHRANFPAGMDERAFIIDKMTPEQKQDLAKDIAKMKPEEKQRFIRSLKVYEDSKVSGQ